MFNISRAGKSKCRSCPLRDKNRVWGEADHDKPKVVIVGEAPGAEEDREGRPFVGKAGKFFIRACSIAGLKWGSAYKTNVISCRPPRNDIGSMEANEAYECCKKGFVYEIQRLAGSATVFLIAGKTAMEAFGIDGSITKNRGSVYLCKILENTNQIVQTNRLDGNTIIVIPTFHPSYIMRGQWKEEVTWVNDIEKAKNISIEGYEPPKEKFTCFPTIEEVSKFCKKVVKNKDLIGVDIETSGLDPQYSKIWVVGLARNGEEAISVPFYKQGGDKYWNEEEERTVSSLLNEVLSICPLIFQNALFDVSHLRAHGYKVGAPEHDIMLLHHCIHSELPHNLGYIVSVYGRTPYWKDIVLRNEDTIKNTDDKMLREYNLRDCVVLHQVLGPMLEHIEKVGTEHVYRETSMKLIEPILTMQENGIRVNEKKLKAFRRELEKSGNTLLEHLYEMSGIGSSLNFDSGDDLRYLFYGIKPKKYQTALKNLKEYDVEDSRKSKETKAYKNLLAVKQAIEETTPFCKTRATVRTSDAGNAKVDNEARLNIMIAANNRISEIEELKNPSNKQKELNELYRLTDFIATFEEYQKTRKLLTTYTKYDIGKDGRVHTHYLIHGTASGRLSSRNPNLQNVPDEAKKVFEAEEGWSLIEFDYSNLELRVLAIESEDDVLKQIFKEGKNVHTENCKRMFGIDESDPLWKPARRACKTYIFGRNYGGGLRGIFERVVKAVPQLNLTYARFTEIDRAYRRAHPQYVKWVKKITGRVKATRKLENGVGRVRFFLGTPDQIVREGLNFPIQSLAADVLNRSLIDVHSLFKNYEYAKLVGTVHDSVLLEVRDKHVDKVIKEVKKIMEQPFEIRGEKVSFPVGDPTEGVICSVGKSWGKLKDYK